MVQRRSASFIHWWPGGHWSGPAHWRATLGIVLATIACCLSPVFAADTDKTRQVGHYASSDGAVGFVLDRSDALTRLRFDGTYEILLLDAIPAPRGDTIFKLESGATILRQTTLGGMTLFDDSRPQGRPVGRDDDAEPLLLPARFPAQIRVRAAAIAQELNERFGTEIVFEGEWDAVPDTRGTATLSDTVELTGIALTRLAVDELGREALAGRIDRVTFTAGELVGARIDEKTLSITYVWSQGVEGRLSSDALFRYLENNL